MPEITIETIGDFLTSRGWRKVTDWSFEDSTGVFKKTLHWAPALEVQLQRDHKREADQMARGLAAMAPIVVGASH